MVDIFEEVEEQLRSARYRTLALKALPWVAGVMVAALVVALAVWGYTSHQAAGAAKASENYAAALAHAQGGDLDRAYDEFGEAAKSGSKGYRSLALMQQGAIRLEGKRVAEAVALFDQAADGAPTPLIADAARLQAVYALMDTANIAEIEGRLKPLLATDRPFRDQAREALALTRLSFGQVAAARDDFTVLTQGLDTSDGIRQRAQAALVLIDSGQAASLPAVVKAARALPQGTPAATAAAAPSSTTPKAGAGQ